TEKRNNILIGCQNKRYSPKKKELFNVLPFLENGQSNDKSLSVNDMRLGGNANDVFKSENHVDCWRDCFFGISRITSVCRYFYFWRGWGFRYVDGYRFF